MAYIHKMIQGFHAGKPQRKNCGLAVGRTRLQISTEGQGHSTLFFFFFFFFLCGFRNSTLCRGLSQG
jgi:hypothetical protein